jgi:hypothetical protein
MGVGEALVSFLDDKGIPGMVERAMILPPHSQIGPITPEQRAGIIKGSVVAGVYEAVVDRESAYERLKGKVVASGTGAVAGTATSAGAPAGGVAGNSGGGWLESAGTALGGVLGSGGSRRGDTVVQAMVKSAARTMGSTVGRKIIRGVLGSLLGGSSKR